MLSCLGVLISRSEIPISREERELGLGCLISSLTKQSRDHCLSIGSTAIDFGCHVIGLRHLSCAVEFPGKSFVQFGTRQSKTALSEGLRLASDWKPARQSKTTLSVGLRLASDWKPARQSKTALYEGLRLVSDWKPARQSKTALYEGLRLASDWKPARQSKTTLSVGLRLASD